MSDVYIGRVITELLAIKLYEHDRVAWPTSAVSWKYLDEENRQLYRGRAQEIGSVRNPEAAVTRGK